MTRRRRARACFFTIAWTIQAGDNPPAERTGRALTVWHHDADGRWRILADDPAYDPPK